jgi:subtilisin family serine protease
MKKFILFIAALVVVGMTSMMLTEENDGQPTPSLSLDDNQPLFYKGMITIKVKEAIGDLTGQKGNVSFNIPSLDAKAGKYQVNLLEKRFRYNPEKLKKGMPDLSRIYRIEFPESYPVTKVAREFSGDPNIEYAEPIPINYLLAEPNDPMYIQQQYLPQIHAPEAWDIHKGEDGEEEVVIAIVDSGVDWDHEDLVDNIWQNMGEDLDNDGVTLEFIGGQWVFDPDDENGVDDDGNGYIDDFIGWNFFYLNNDPNPVPGITGNDHGTQCAGIASATTNNGLGVAAISWNLKIMPIESGLNISINRCYDAIIYAAENGADVISNSWAAHFYSQASHEAISYATGLGSIIVAAAGNHNYFSNFYPADYPGVISVAAVTADDHKASYSNYGPNIGISAPGTGILSTTPNNTYQSSAGTSMSAPMVAGLMGLVKSYHPDWTSHQVITQVLGTADTIDYLNPGFENQLGSGRINAYQALLLESGVTLEPEISLDLVNLICHDDDNDQMLEPGDVVNMSFKLRNYNFGIGAENATFTLTSDDPDIIISNNSCSGDIPPDDYFNLENVFEFQISEIANTHLATLILITTADVIITWGDTISFEIPICPEGILVFQGIGTGNAFSGEYINEFLTEQGLQVLFTSQFPFSFNGFDAVFLSYGNFGNRIDDGVVVTLEMTEIITEYIMNGGNIYTECGSFLGGMAYVGYPNLEEMMELFGVEEIETPVSQNPINLLSGLTGSICEGIEFSSSTQFPYWYIDKMIPDENGMAAFEEGGYGTVAVQGEGEYGQKTFCFSYALAHLVDNSQGSRDTLLTRIAEFFDLYDPVANFTADSTIIVQGDTVHFTDLTLNNPNVWEWHFQGGIPETSGDQNPVVVYSTPGYYDVTLIATNNHGSDTLTVPDYITVSAGTGTSTYDYSSEISIYPNPSYDKITISSPAITGNTELTIFNVNGEKVIERQLTDNKTQIDISALSRGVYFVRVWDEKMTEVKKLIKQ